MSQSFKRLTARTAIGSYGTLIRITGSSFAPVLRYWSLGAVARVDAEMNGPGHPPLAILRGTLRLHRLFGDSTENYRDRVIQYFADGLKALGIACSIALPLPPDDVKRILEGHSKIRIVSPTEPN
jgi:hypothetical protein